MTEGVGCMWLSPLTRTAHHSTGEELLEEKSHSQSNPSVPECGFGVKNTLANRDGQIFSVDFMHSVNMAQALEAVPKEQCLRSMDWVGWSTHCVVFWTFLMLHITFWESSLVYILALALGGNVCAGTTVPDKVHTQ